MTYQPKYSRPEEITFEFQLWRLMHNWLLTAFLSLLMFVPAKAQQAVRAVGSPRNTVTYIKTANLEADRISREREIMDLAQRYRVAPTATQEQIRQSVRSLLFELFDLGIQAKEEETRKLSLEIAQMQRNQQFSDNSRTLQVLEEALKTIESTITYRKLNREKIVTTRLAELLAR